MLRSAPAGALAVVGGARLTVTGVNEEDPVEWFTGKRLIWLAFLYAGLTFN